VTTDAENEIREKTAGLIPFCRRAGGSAKERAADESARDTLVSADRNLVRKTRGHRTLGPSKIRS